MIAGVSDVKVAVGIERDAPRIAELAGFAACAAQNFHRLIARVENLNAAVAKLADKLETLRIDTHVVRITQFAFAATRRAIRTEPFAIGRKDLNAMIARVS